MRVVLLAIAVALVLGAACARGSDEGGAATLRIVSDQPFVVAGSGFVAHERVRLLVSAQQSMTQTLRAGRLGRFRVALPMRGFPRCGGIVVQALGNRGSRATIDRPGPDCAPIG